MNHNIIIIAILSIISSISLLIGLFYFSKYLDLLKLTNRPSKLNKTFIKALVYTIVVPYLCFGIINRIYKKIRDYKIISSITQNQSGGNTTETIQVGLVRNNFLTLELSILVTITLMIYPFKKVTSIDKKIGIIYVIIIICLFYVILVITKSHLLAMIHTNMINLILTVYLMHYPLQKLKNH
ncbi:MAG: hypothetical protein ACMXYG_02660 [Candidatus Woesearchaeota archaeon]